MRPSSAQKKRYWAFFLAIDTSKASGPDGISETMVKNTALSLRNKTFQLAPGRFPTSGWYHLSYEFPSPH